MLVAGKGHETYQDIQGVKSDFDDKQVIAECLRCRNLYFVHIFLQICAFNLLTCFYNLQGSMFYYLFEYFDKHLKYSRNRRFSIHHVSCFCGNNYVIGYCGHLGEVCDSYGLQMLQIGEEIRDLGSGRPNG